MMIDEGRQLATYSIRRNLLFESHTNAISLPPNDITGEWSIVSLEKDAKALGDILGVTDLDCCTGNAHVTDQAIDRNVSVFDHAGQQYRFAGS
jgi:hypothetical protein